MSVEIEKTIVAVITNHLEPFIDKVNNLLKMFKELDCSKRDIKDLLDKYIDYELTKLSIKVVFGLVAFVIFILIGVICLKLV